MKTFQIGDKVIYRKAKSSEAPGPRAANIHPAPHGDIYTYTVDKFWVVTDCHSDGTLLIKTRRGKTHEIQPSDPHLRPAAWWEKLIYMNRFPGAETK